MLALLFHGIDIFYDEESIWLLQNLSEKYILKSYIVGTMGITSLFDSRIEGVELIFKRPSKAISELEGFDKVIIVLKARSIETAKAFLGTIGERVSFDGEILGIDINTRSLFEVKPGLSDIKTYLLPLGYKEEYLSGGIDVKEEGDLLVRSVKGCKPGELLLFKGLVVGTVTSKDVKIFVKDKKIQNISGVKIKKHGLEKIKEIDIYSIKIDSTPGFETRDSTLIKKLKGDQILFINHDAYSIYKNLSNISGAVTVGDDTTRISGYILKRFGIPVIGIIDGDKDGVIKGEQFYTGSVLFHVEKDDIEGDKIFSYFFNKNSRIKSDYKLLRVNIENFLGEKILKKIEY
ncbi:MAG: DUF2117 domain-containing protein [Candidatus Methanofastidiosa archaeon]|nr:DUF2117 domain-containing protein [Candidatus Methanofastidiosa archaeon]